jgi:nitronate monooxygenase
MWPNARLTKLFGIEHPIVLAPMAGAMDFELVAAVSAAGGLGSLPCAMLTPDALRDQLTKVRARTDRPVNVNFFCHTPPVPNNAREARWRDQLKPYYEELGIDPAVPVPSSNRMPFDAAFCAVVEELKPQVVSFHFGLPEASLVRRVKAAGCVLISSATITAEAVFLERHGVDAVIAQGYEAGGHRCRQRARKCHRFHPCESGKQVVPGLGIDPYHSPRVGCRGGPGVTDAGRRVAEIWGDKIARALARAGLPSIYHPYGWNG